MNVLLKSILFNPAFRCSQTLSSRRHRVYLWDRQYPMVKNGIKFWNSRSACESAEAGLEVRELKATLGMLKDERQLIQCIVDEVLRDGGVEFMIIDHVCWSPGMIMPIEEVCAQIRGREPTMGRTFIIIDGAHAIGQLDLQPLFARNAAHQAATGYPLFDAYFSNFHKWFMAPRSAAFLYVSRSHHRYLHPNMIANHYRGHAGGCAEDSEFDNSPAALHHEFFWSGTRDLSNLMVLPYVLNFRRDVLGGEDVIRAYCHSTLLAGVRRVCDIWRTEPLLSDSDRVAAIATVECPCSVPEATKAVEEMMRESNAVRCFLPVLNIDDRAFARLSAQVFTTVEDFERGAALFLDALSRVQV
jgi:selenocysteine lyase/cysteine desulfurase